MKSSSQIPLERLPQLWAADAHSLRKLGVTTAGDLVQIVHENGLTTLSDSSDIPVDQLRQYFNTAQTASAREKTRGGATVAFVFVWLGIVVASGWMLYSLLPGPAEAAYASLYDDFSKEEIATKELNDLKEEVDKKLEDLKDRPAESLVNLRLLKAAIDDTLALEQLRAAGNDPSTADYKARYERYQSLFDEARAEHALIAKSDPRISLARLNAAQAWTSRAKIRSALDVKNLDKKEIERISSDVEIAEANAFKETTLIRNTTDLSGELLGLIQPAVFDERINETYQPPSVSEQVKKQFEQVQKQFGELKSELVTDLRKQMENQETSILSRVDVAHDETRTLIDKDNAILALQVHSVDERYVVDIGATPNAPCGLRDIAAAKRTIHAECIPRTGLSKTVGVDISVENDPGNSAPSVVVENGEAPNPLACAIDDVMARFDYDDGVHGCRLVIRIERSNVYGLSTQP